MSISYCYTCILNCVFILWFCYECRCAYGKVPGDLEYWVDPRSSFRKTNDNGKISVNLQKTNKTIGSFRSSVNSSFNENKKIVKINQHFRAHPNPPRVTKMTNHKYYDPKSRHKQGRDKSVSDVEGMTDLSPYAIKKQLRLIAKKFPDANTTLDVIGRTVEYNDIVLMKITKTIDTERHFRAEDDKYADDPPKKKIIFIVHGLMVMGFQKGQSLLWISNIIRLLGYYLEYLDKFDIFFIPMANPDGISAAEEDFWNKNMSPQLACPGVNVDRNFDVVWNSSQDLSSCSQHYPGPAPFTEAESKAIRDVFHKYSDKIIAYINVHYGTYNFDTFKGEAVLYPKGYTDVQADDDKYIDMKGEVEEALRNASFTTFPFTMDSLSGWYGKVFGTSVDYASTIYGVPYALEFVMQLYENVYVDTEETYTDSSIKEVWRRIINVVFKNIWKSTSGAQDDNPS
ncbi:carboxypeptidase B-like [Leptidea sinapis]|uniref:carboxypeptidase B-like n=1 Tax=Leptidea sinapis TaxID=189913 RepID=UPI0021343D53|nr:carboxypeptidase B-like [Leptidea sinapis]